MKHFVATVFLIAAVLMMDISVCAESDEAVAGTLDNVNREEFSQRVEVTGNFDITFTFDSYDGDGITVCC
ncbi:MAG: hypothetical protein SPF70_08840 [Lachnospiraceae bacterium]|nr:hypothetical protein [Lachnospiraceae bacterium]